MPVAVLFVMAIASIGIYGIVLGGWSSGSTYSLLGGLRSSAQMISYEVAMGLALVAVFLYAGSMSTSEIVAAQDDLWFGLILLPSFVIYMISMVGETNRAPFDLPEAEGELVGGFHTEYSSLKFALFFLAEYINMATVSVLATTLFLGGWHAPFWIDEVWAGANEGYWPVLWFFGKVLFFIFIFIWLRGTLPRLRYDQFMAFGWKRLIPVAGVDRGGRAPSARSASTTGSTGSTLIGIGVLAVVFLVLFFVAPRRRRRGEPAERAADAFAGGFPVPPMPAGGPARGAAAALTFDKTVTGRLHDGRRGELRCPRSRSSSGIRSPGSASRSGRCSRRSSPSSTRSRSSRRRRASTAGTSSTAGPTGSRSASGASCAPGPARPTRSTSRARPTPRTSASAR